MKNFLRTVFALLALFLVGFCIWAMTSEPSQDGSNAKQASSQSEFQPATESQASKSTSKTKASSSKNKTSDTDKKKKPSTPKSSIDDEALVAGDYTGIVGTWSDATGRSLTITVDGQADYAGNGGNIEVAQDGKGELLMTVYLEDGTSLPVLIYKAGQEIPDRHFQNGKDSSDQDKDRMVIPTTDILDESGKQVFTEQVLYRES